MKVALFCSALVMFVGVACADGAAPADLAGSASTPAATDAGLRRASSCNDPARNYFSHDKKQCQVIRFMCPVNEVPFSDRCGCGCVDACPTSACPSPAPASPTQLCSDGSTAGPECQPQSNGACGWVITTCP